MAKEASVTERSNEALLWETLAAIAPGTELRDALERILRERTGATGVVFLGDDVTDEDGFRALHQPPDVGVKVGEGDTAAVVQLADVDAVAHFLTELATARAAHIGHSRGDDA